MRFQERNTSFSQLAPQFLERWSPRGFLSESISDNDLKSMFEAARWAPSCYNDQPWFFMYSKRENKHAFELFLSCLVEGNQIWAKHAPVLSFICARKHFAHNGKENTWAEFDTGSAWMSLALQAHYLGLSAHGMAGFDAEAVYEKLKLPREKFRVIAAIAIGKKGPADKLPNDIQKSEKPNQRNPLEQMIKEGVYAS